MTLREGCEVSSSIAYNFAFDTYGSRPRSFGGIARMSEHNEW